MEKGVVVAISISKRKGEKKENVKEANLIEDRGIENDAHAEGGERQVSLLMDESIDRMRECGLKVSYGEFAENIVTRGIDHRKLGIDNLLRVGDGVILRVVMIGKECPAPCRIFDQVGYCIMPEEGLFCRVERSGKICVGDRIYVE